VHKTVITSFTETGYAKYGKDFIETFKKHWPKDIRLLVYYEGDSIRDDWHFIDEVEGLLTFIDKLQFPMMKGDMGDGSWNIQLDATQNRNLFMIRHAANLYGGHIIWCDADIITHTDITHEVLDGWIKDKFCVYLGRDGWNFPDYSETGFLIFNTQHQLFANYFGACMAILDSGMIFTLPNWHDSRTFDTARLVFKNHADEFVNLASHLPPNSTIHPFINSDLGKYMDHKKGKRKGNRSDPSELIIPQEGDYWKKETPSPIIVPNVQWGT
jgi:hypothetical protein